MGAQIVAQNCSQAWVHWDGDYQWVQQLNVALSAFMPSPFLAGWGGHQLTVAPLNLHICAVPAKN